MQPGGILFGNHSVRVCLCSGPGEKMPVCTVVPSKWTQGMGVFLDLAAVHPGCSMSRGQGVMQCHVCLCNTQGVAGPVFLC